MKLQFWKQVEVEKFITFIENVRR